MLKAGGAKTLGEEERRRRGRVDDEAEENYGNKRGCRVDGSKSLLVVVARCKRSEGGEGCRATLEARKE